VQLLSIPASEAGVPKSFWVPKVAAVTRRPSSQEGYHKYIIATMAVDPCLATTLPPASIHSGATQAIDYNVFIPCQRAIAWHHCLEAEFSARGQGRDRGATERSASAACDRRGPALRRRGDHAATRREAAFDRDAPMSDRSKPRSCAGPRARQGTAGKMHQSHGYSPQQVSISGVSHPGLQSSRHVCAYSHEAKTVRNECVSLSAFA
jgi:hypothetical protein